MIVATPMLSPRTAADSPKLNTANKPMLIVKARFIPSRLMLTT